VRKLKIFARLFKVHVLTHSATVVLGTAMMVTVLLTPWKSSWPKIARLWSRHVLRVSDVKVSMKSYGNFDLDKPFILMSNHVSNMDIPTLFQAFPVEFRFLTKHTLKYVPFFGWAMMAAKFIFVDRSNPEKARQSIDAAAAAISGGRSIAVFPEGTRSPDGNLLPFKKGGFVLAVKTGVQVIPVYLKGAYEAMPKDTYETKAAHVEVRVGDAIDAREYTLDTKDELMARVRADIERLGDAA
jgi:1-acyl-sn-glycerol-3-phosphate acyltransferase